MPAGEIGILIVGDDGNCEGIAACLKVHYPRANYFHARNKSDMLRVIKEQCCFLIIIGDNLDDQDRGPDLVARLRANDITARIVVLITDESVREECFTKGATAVCERMFFEKNLGFILSRLSQCP